MDFFSQHCLKVAATRPEHVVRKAEFDSALETLDERIVVIEKSLDIRPGLSGAVLGGKGAVETSEFDDIVSVPFPTSLSERAGISDEFDSVKTSPLVGTTPREATGLGDTATVPLPETLSETFRPGDETCSARVLPIRGRPDDDAMTVSDSVRTRNFKENSMEPLKLQGEIAVVVEDRSGKVRERQIVSNAITEAYERYVFYDMLNIGNLHSLLRSHTRSGFNFLARTLPTSFGIYALDRDIDINKGTFLPPYVGDDQASLAESVSFYNVGGSLSESELDDCVFGVWYGSDSPVDTERPPDVTVWYSSSMTEYQTSFEQQAPAWVAVAAIKPGNEMEKGKVHELYLDWSNITPRAPDDVMVLEDRLRRLEQSEQEPAGMQRPTVADPFTTLWNG